MEVAGSEGHIREALADIAGLHMSSAEAIGSSGRIAVTVETAPGKDLRGEIAARIVGRGMGLYELRGASPVSYTHLYPYGVE